MEAVEADTQRLVVMVRNVLGVGSRTGALPRMASAVAASQGGAFLVTALAVFVALDQLLSTALSVLGPDIRAALGLSEGSYGIIVSQRANAAVAMSLQFAARRHALSHRRLLVSYAAIATGTGAVLSALSSSFWPLFFAVGVSCPTAGVVWVVHRPMVMDGYQPQVRMRAMSMHQAGIVAGSVVAPLVLVVLTGPAGLSWRGALVVIGLAGVASAALGLRLPDPRLGLHDTDRVREAVQAELGSSPTDGSDEVPLGFLETLRRLWLVPTIPRLLGAWAVLGVVVTPLLAYMSFHLNDRWHIGIGGRAAFIGCAWLFALPALAWFAPRADELFHRDPSQLLAAAAITVRVLAAGLVVAAFAPFVVVSLVGLGCALAASAVLVPSLVVTSLSVVQPRARPAAGALVAVFMVGIGGQGGAALLGGLDRRFGPDVAIALLAVPALVAARLVRRASASVNADIDHVLAEVVEQEEIRALVQRGNHLPMLACRHVDFSYGQLQVLFDVNFTVDEGEMVALLGTNGAGKSTLLRVVSGLGLPTRGTVRLDGADITYLDAERRLSLGITQIPGGRAVFGRMSVAENLKVLGFSHGRNRRAVEAGIDASFDAFPRLAERRNQLAATLSGGEQQMLGLATALIVRPRLLLIDELSLGLAPRVVGELLEMVRRINDSGTAVVLVEQSVNIALSVVQHAYFMEKGQTRFDGPAADLLARPDLLRSVFLEGASKSLARDAAPGG